MHGIRKDKDAEAKFEELKILQPDVFFAIAGGDDFKTKTFPQQIFD